MVVPDILLALSIPSSLDLGIYPRFPVKDCRGFFFDLAANVEANVLALVSGQKVGIMRRKCLNIRKCGRNPANTGSFANVRGCESLRMRTGRKIPANVATNVFANVPDPANLAANVFANVPDPANLAANVDGLANVRRRFCLAACFRARKKAGQFPALLFFGVMLSYSGSA